MKSARLLLTLLLAAGIIGYVIWRSSVTSVAEVEITGFQDAATPFSMPQDGQPDMRFHFLSAWQANQIPTAHTMDTPMGSENGALVYNAQKFWEMNARRGGHHTGDDLNGIGGMNSDLGDPIFAAADGLVIYTGEPSPGWGNIIVLAHRHPTGKPIHTMYAHLLEIKTRLGTLVSRGEIIATNGTANGHYPAHLHFEARTSDGVDIGSGYASLPLNRLDPQAVIAALHHPDPEAIYPSALHLANASPDQPWTTLNIQNSEKMLQLTE